MESERIALTAQHWTERQNLAAMLEQSLRTQMQTEVDAHNVEKNTAIAQVHDHLQAARKQHEALSSKLVSALASVSMVQVRCAVHAG